MWKFPHIWARAPSHAAWQGKIYSLSGESKKYPSFYEVCKPGTPDGICGINCRHSYYPYFEGMSAHYTDDELDEMKEPSVRYNGQKIIQKNGHSVYFLPEKSTGKNADVIMDGILTEFKNITGNENAVAKRFNEGMKQAQNIFLNIESTLSRQEVCNKIKGEVKANKYTSGIIYVRIANRIFRWNINDMQ